MNYELMGAAFDPIYEGRIQAVMSSFLNRTVRNEQVDTLLRGYHELIKKSKIDPFTFDIPPEVKKNFFGFVTSTEYGQVSSKTAIDIKKLKELTGLTLVDVNAFANALYNVYSLGELPHEIYSPKRYKEGVEAQEKLDIDMPNFLDDTKNEIRKTINKVIVAGGIALTVYILVPAITRSVIRRR